VNVGEVLSYDLGDGVGPVILHVFVRSPYDRFVQSGTRFWNTSGLSLNVTGQGLHLEAQSLQAIVSGGIAFETRDPTGDSSESPEGAAFPLYDDEAAADSASYSVRVPFVAYTRSSVQGLSVGSEVQMFGVEVGVVTEVRLVEAPPASAAAHPPGPAARIAFDLQPQRVHWEPDCFAPATMRAMVAQGLRVVLQPSNLITGQKELALQYVPGAAAAEAPVEGAEVVLPSQGGGFDDISASLADVAAKLQQVPFDAIGKDVDRTIRAVEQTVSGTDMRDALRSFSETMHEVATLARHANAGMTPVLERLPSISEHLQEAVDRANTALGEGGYGEHSDFQRRLERMMDQMNGAARTIRLLADFLDRHPESIIRGRAAQGLDR
jgi:paraquat-inducible protein B